MALETRDQYTHERAVVQAQGRLDDLPNAHHQPSRGRAARHQPLGGLPVRRRRNACASRRWVGLTSSTGARRPPAAVGENGEEMESDLRLHELTSSRVNCRADCQPAPCRGLLRLKPHRSGLLVPDSAL